MANIRPHELFPVARLNWPGSLTDAPILEQTQPPWHPVIIDSLWWPWSASRFARAHVVVSEKNLNLIRLQAYAGNTYRPLPFTIDDGFYSTPVTTKLWMLPARPLSQATTVRQGGEALYLLTLVDDRYFWWETSCQYTVTEGITQWTDIYAAIGLALGVSIAADPISSAYSLPNVAYAASYRPTPAVLDAIAFAVGQRIVRRLDGTVQAQNATTALANQATQLTIYKQRRRRGGSFDLSATAPTDLSALVPRAVEVVFPAVGPGKPANGFWPDTTTLAALKLRQYPQPQVGGQPWTKVLHRYEQAAFAGTAIPANKTALDALTTRVATDWLLWQLAILDEWFAGTVPWKVDGLADLEWRQVNQEITTHVQRGVLNPQEDLIPLPAAPPPAIPCIEPPASITNVCDMVCFNGRLFKYLQTTYFSCAGVAPGPCVLNSIEGCCDCDELCPCCTPDAALPCPWWLCLWWPSGYCGGKIVFFSGPSSGTTIPLAFVKACQWCDATSTLCFTKNVGTPGYTLVFGPGNEVGCATYSSSAPLNCDVPYRVFFVSATVGFGCKDCGDWPPFLDLTPSFALPQDGDPCGGMSSGYGASSGGGAVICCDPTVCPIPDGWHFTFSLRGCPVDVPKPCPVCSGASPPQIDVALTGFSGVFGCFNGVWECFFRSDLTTAKGCAWYSVETPCGVVYVSVTEGEPGAVWSWVVFLLGADGNNAQYELDFGAAPVDCCSPATVPLNFATAPGAAASVAIAPVCAGGGGGTDNVDCACDAFQGVGAIGCCWEGPIASVFKPNKGTTLFCLNQNADGSLEWVLEVLINGIVVAIYTADAGPAPICCCDELLLALRYTTCAGASPFAGVRPIGVQCGSSGGAMFWCVCIEHCESCVSCPYDDCSVVCVSDGGQHWHVGESIDFTVSPGVVCGGKVLAGPYVNNTCGGACPASCCGSSSSSASSGGEIGTACCPGGVPSTLFVTLNGGSGGATELCGCLNGTYPVTWVPGSNRWTNSVTVCSGHALVITLFCENGLPCAAPTPWLLELQADTGGTGTSCGSIDCDTLTGTFTQFGAGISGLCNNIDGTRIVAVVSS